MGKTVLLLVFISIAAGVHAQGVELARQRLARPDESTGARVTVTEKADAAAVVQSNDHADPEAKITAYGVSLFLDNSQMAGSNARAVAAQFAGLFPEISVRTTYESPYFKVVAAGYFVDRTDAVALCGKVLAGFAKAFVVQEEITVSEMIKRRKEAAALASAVAEVAEDDEAAKSTQQ